MVTLQVCPKCKESMISAATHICMGGPYMQVTKPKKDAKPDHEAAARKLFNELAGLDDDLLLRGLAKALESTDGAAVERCAEMAERYRSHPTYYNSWLHFFKQDKT